MASPRADHSSSARRVTPSSMSRWILISGYDLLVPDRFQYVVSLANRATKTKLYERRRKRAVWETMADVQLKRWAGEESKFTVSEALRNYHGTRSALDKSCERFSIFKRGATSAYQRKRLTDPKFAETLDLCKNAWDVAYGKLILFIAAGIMNFAKATQAIDKRTEERRNEYAGKLEGAWRKGMDRLEPMIREEKTEKIRTVFESGRSMVLRVHEQYGKPWMIESMNRAKALLASIAPWFSVVLSCAKWMVALLVRIVMQVHSDVNASLKMT